MASMPRHVEEPAREIPVVQDCDVCVLGGSCTGVFAAVRAAQMGASVAILFFVSLLTVTRVGVSNTLLLHVNNFYWGFSSEQIGVFMLVIFLSLFPALWLATRGTASIGKRNAAVCSVAGVALTHPIVVLACWRNLLAEGLRELGGLELLDAE